MVIVGISPTIRRLPAYSSDMNPIPLQVAGFPISTSEPSSVGMATARRSKNCYDGSERWLAKASLPPDGSLASPDHHESEQH